MPADALTDTVAVDRDELRDALIEMYAVVDVLERLAGTSPTSLTDELGPKLEALALALLGELPDNDSGPRIELWDAGRGVLTR
jgi:hypothetical protein